VRWFLRLRITGMRKAARAGICEAMQWAAYEDGSIRGDAARAVICVDEDPQHIRDCALVRADHIQEPPAFARGGLFRPPSNGGGDFADPAAAHI